MSIFSKFVEWRKSKSVKEGNEITDLLTKMHKTLTEIMRAVDDIDTHEYEDNELSTKMVDLELTLVRFDVDVNKVKDLIESGAYKPKSYNKHPWYNYYVKYVQQARAFYWKYISEYHSSRALFYMKKSMELIEDFQMSTDVIIGLRNDIKDLTIEKERLESLYSEISDNSKKELTVEDYLLYIAHLVDSKLAIAPRVSEFDLNIHDAVYYNKCLCIKQAVFRTMFDGLYPSRNIDEIIELLKHHYEVKPVINVTEVRDTVLIPYITQHWGNNHHFYAIYRDSYESLSEK